MSSDAPSNLIPHIAQEYEAAVPIDSLEPHPDNPNRGDDDAVAESIKSNGFYGALIGQRSRRRILAGHTRWRSDRRAGADTIPVIWVDVDDAQARRIMLADNEYARKATVDDDLLALNLAAILEGSDLDGSSDEPGDLTGTGYDQAYYDDLLARLAGDDPDGDPAEEAPAGPTLADRFLIPPFSVLDTRQGYWADRKRRWMAIGLRSEVGRGGNLADKGQESLDAIAEGGESSALTIESLSGRVPDYYAQKRRAEAAVGHELSNPDFEEHYLVIPEGGGLGSSGTSVFDPVLCELAYRWFSPVDGRVIDPFAGGSVRGVVAAALGREYTGVELRAEQVEANQQQWDELADRIRPAATAERADTVSVRISSKSARQKFAGCQPDYIANVCHGSCCRSTSSPTGIIVTIHPSEEAAIAARGATVIDGLLQPADGEKQCPFQTDTNLCGIHGEPEKPFGCIASPFTLAPGGRTLIIRNRYRSLKCYNDGDQIPAYIAFRASLDLIFGETEAQRICDHLDGGGGDITATMPRDSYDRLLDNDRIKKGDTPTAGVAAGPVAAVPDPTWIQGDSSLVVPAMDAEQYDLVFSCPPYADLEVYSDDPADISNMPYPQFLDVYRSIIAAAVRALRPNRFAVWVIGDVRDKAGNYVGLVPDTIRAFEDAGAAFYNEGILVTPVGSLPVRVGRQFAAGRKLGKTHQNVLVFVKGDGRAATDACGLVDITFPGADLDE